MAVREKSAGIMRTLVLAAAIALTLLAPAVTLGAPTRGFHGAPPQQAPPPRGGAGHSIGQDSFKVPFHVDARPKPVRTEVEPLFLPYRLHAWQQGPRYVGPTWFQNGCFANNTFGTPSTLQSDSSVPTSVTIGSLVDDRSKHLFSSKPSYNPNSASSDAITMTNPTGLQYQFQPTECGSSSLIKF